MRQASALTLLLVPLLAVPLAPAETAWSTSGTYLAGSPLSHNVADACALAGRPTSGVDGNCVYLPDLVGYRFALDARDDAGLPVDAHVCFYDVREFITCGGDFIPERASYFSVTSNVGVRVSWTFAAFT